MFILRKIILFSTVILFSAVSTLWSQYFGQNKVQYQSFKWHFLQSEHFDVYFYPGGYDIAVFTANEAESAYVQLKQDFQYEITARVSIILYKSHNDFQQTNVVDVYLVEGIGGLTELYKNRVVIPFEGSHSQLRHVLHHELVHAVMNDMLYGGSVQSLISGQVVPVPLWFAEGLSEYFSLRWDTRIDMVVRDAIITGYMPPILYLDYYLAYQGGASVFRYIAERYGHKKVAEILHKIKGSFQFEGAIQSALGIKLDELSEDWQKDLRRRYWPDIVERKETKDIARPLTNHKQTKNYLNISPALSPNGDKMAFLSNKDGNISIYLMDVLENKIIKRLVKGETSVDFEQLHWLSPGMDWSPDGEKITFAAKAGDQDALYILDVGSNRTQQFKFNLDGIYSAAWSPLGDEIAFIGLTNGASNIYIYNIVGGKLEKLTDDVFSDSNPAWSPDGQKIVFVSERGPYLSSEMVPEGFQMSDHDYDNTDIYVIDRTTGEITRITDSFFRESDPIFSADGTRLLYVSEETGIGNIYIHDLETNESYPITNLLTGAFQLNTDKDGKTLAFSSFLEGGWDIYTIKNPFEMPAVSPELTAYAQKLRDERLQVEVAAQSGELREEEDEEEAEETSIALNDSVKQRVTIPQSVDYSRYVFADLDRKTQIKEVDVQLDKETYQMDDGHYKVRNYRVKFSPDVIYGAAQYNTLWGFQGFTQLAFSDVLGNHKIFLGTNLVFDLRNSYLTAQYWYLPKRIDYGFSAYHYANTYISSYYGIMRFRNYGLMALASRPFNRFTRVDFSLYWFNVMLEYLQLNYPTSTVRSILPGIQLVHDTSEWGFTGPRGGFRGAVSATFSPSYSSDSPEFVTLKTDLRRYVKLNNFYSFAFRLAAGTSVGKDPQKFFLGGVDNWVNREFNGNIRIDDIKDVYFSEFVTPLRGARYYERTGNTFALTNVEFRFPLIPYMQLGLPPIRLGNIQGVLFADIGSAWDAQETGKLRLGREGRFQDIIAGYGTGARIFFLGFLIRYDLAWEYDWKSSSKPKHYWSLGIDF